MSWKTSLLTTFYSFDAVYGLVTRREQRIGVEGMPRIVKKMVMRHNTARRCIIDEEVLSITRNGLPDRLL